MLDESVQKRIFALLESGAFWCVGAAPECASFSRAVNPPVRSRDLPEGLPFISAAMRVKVERGNQHAAFVLKVVCMASARNMAYWVENPDGSFLWLLHPMLSHHDPISHVDPFRAGHYPENHGKQMHTVSILDSRIIKGSCPHLHPPVISWDGQCRT